MNDLAEVPRRERAKFTVLSDNLAAFTRIEFLVVLGLVALLTLVAVTAMAHSQPASDRVGCANNLRRLMQAWQMYADDNSGQLMANGASAGSLPWVGGSLDYNPANADNTSYLKLTNAVYAAIAPYVNSPFWMRCPADPSTLVSAAGPRLRVRSYSMNSYVGLGTAAWSANYQVMTKSAEVCQPERIFVLLEEHPDGINDSAFVIDLAHAGAGATLVDIPAAFHLGGANFGMADGHVDSWQWSDARTMPPVRGLPLSLNVPMPNNPDVARLQAATSYLK